MAAAKVAALALEGTLYERYYGIDYRQILAIDGVTTASPFDQTPLTFDALCAMRAEVPEGSWSPAANGMVIEQAQILNTHNLAVLVSLGAQAGEGWDRLAWQAVQRMFALIQQVEIVPRPLATIKNAAYAWRQAVFFLAQLSSDRQEDVLSWAEAHLNRLPEHARATSQSGTARPATGDRYPIADGR